MLLHDLIIRQKGNAKIAVIDKNTRLTYAELYSQAKKVSEYIRSTFGPCQNVALFLPNSAQYVIAYLAIALSGNTIVPISTMAKKPEVLSTIEYCDIRLIITNHYFSGILQQFIAGSDTPISVFVIDQDTFCHDNGIHNFLAGEENIILNEDSTAILLHTSGTTGRPKRVMLTHRNLISNVESNIASLGFTDKDISLIALPMYFGYCNTAQFLTHLYLGATIVIMDRLFSPAYFFSLVNTHGITNFTGVPSMLLMFLSLRNKDKLNAPSLKTICFGGGNMPVEKLRELITSFPDVGFVQTYGQTEASPRITCLLPEDSLRKIGSVGKPIPGVQVAIVDDTGTPVEPGQPGEIIVHGKNVMKGYYKRPEDTEKTIQNGWLHTGDIGRYDDEGYIYLVGRKKNIIISGGINIYPEEVEEMLLSHSAVKEACVTGMNHEWLGEVPIAKVVLHEGKTISVDALMNFCCENLSGYKVPERISIVNSLPKTLTGKMKRVQDEGENHD